MTEEIKKPKKPKKDDVFLAPKVFMEKMLAQLNTVVPNSTYDARRFFAEETDELLKNFEDHRYNKALLIDDIVDVLWTTIALKPTPLNEAELNRAMSEMLLGDNISIYKRVISQRVRQALMSTEDPYKSFLDHVCLGVIIEVIRYARATEVKWQEAFTGLVGENMSKLDAPEELWAEVYRDGKCNKKDKDGRLYPHYKPCDFSQFI